jgi:hypothetical protein
MGGGFMLDFLGHYDFSGVQSSRFLVNHDSVSFMVSLKTQRPNRNRPGLHFGLIVLSALKSSVSASAQGFFSFFAAPVIARLAAIRATAIAPEADVKAGHAFAHLDFEVCAAFDTGCRNVSNAFTG